MTFLARIAGLFRRDKSAPASGLASISAGRDGWWSIAEHFTGAWQRSATLTTTELITSPAVWACCGLIAGDISKLRIRLLEEVESGVWLETKNPAYTPVLRRPNRYQTWGQLIECWILGKLCAGNTYVLKVRDGRGITIALHCLDPRRCRPMVTAQGDVWYEVAADDLAGVGETLYVPASEIIHDRWNCYYHPLVGIAPLRAAALAAQHGLSIQESSVWFFRNKSMPAGILSGPGQISQQTADRIREYWSKHFTGENIGKIAVLGDGLKFEPQPFISAEDAQLIEQLKWTSEQVCQIFHVPAYKLGLGTRPNYASVVQLNSDYYQNCLQVLIEAAEAVLDFGLGLPDNLAVEFDVATGLLRMDEAAAITAARDGLQCGLFTINEARQRLNLPKVKGGDVVYLQQQQYSLEALAKRDAKDDPFAGSTAPTPPAAEKPQDPAPDGADAAN